MVLYIGIMGYFVIKNNDDKTEKLNPRNQAVNEVFMIGKYISFNSM